MTAQFSERLFLPRLRAKYGELSPERMEWGNMIDGIKRTTPKNCHILYCLLSGNTSFEECRDNYLEWCKSDKFSAPPNSLEQLMMQHGRVDGERVYNERLIANSERGKRNTIFNDKSKQSDIQAAAIAGQKRKRAEDENYDRKRTRYFPEYYMARGFNESDSERMAARSRIEHAPPKAFRKDFTCDEWRDRCEKIKATKLSRLSNARSSTRTSASSLKWFDALAPLLTADAQYGSGNEWWIRDGDSYYFLDFVIHEAKIVIEYNGHKFHPRAPVDPKYGFRGLPTSTEKWDVDERKRGVIKDAGYLLFEVWDDELPELTNFAKVINEKIQLRRAEALSPA